MSHADILTDIHAMPPVDTTYVAGRWHHDRATLKGVSLEARVFLKSLTVPRNDNRRFLIIGRARSGTTLLTRLLNGHSQIHCDGEVFKRSMLSPLGYFDRLASKSPAAAYGAKLLSYQMVQVHRMRRPQEFFRRLTAEGVQLIHLERGTFLQTLSLAVAQQRRQFHSDKGAGTLQERIVLDPQDFVARVAWSEALLAYERAALAEVAHLNIVYERDLGAPDTQTETLGQICTLLGVAHEEVSVPLRKVLPTDPTQIIQNYDAVCEALETSGYGSVLSDMQ